MKIVLLAIGTKMPQWVEDGYLEYAKRLGRDCSLTLKEIASPRRSNSQDPKAVCKKEGELLLAAIPKGGYPIALDEKGALQSTQSIANKCKELSDLATPLVLLVGGADGHSDEVLLHCKEKWSLSKLTFPHAMVRVIVAEQIYRAVSLLNNHPYHRV